MSKPKAVVAAGHKETALAAAQVLENGGNAFDAVVAAHFAACVAEPVLASLGGGGFLLAHVAGGRQCVYDHFVQTPQQKQKSVDTEFFPISADFGIAQQEFHIGRGSVATPGTIRGLFKIHQDLCSWPMHELAERAITLARDGLTMNAFQAYIFDIVKAIYRHSPESKRIFGSRTEDGKLLVEGEILQQHKFADFIDSLVREGEDLFYRGEIAQRIQDLCSDGGHLCREDLESYQVIKRKPLSIDYRNAKLVTNPAPSSGGVLIGFALSLMAALLPQQNDYGTGDYLGVLAKVMDATNKVRGDNSEIEEPWAASLGLPGADIVAKYKSLIQDGSVCSRGTTQISVIDKQGNMASLTTSNGEGCGYCVPGTGIMLNNMLGEEDLNPRGFDGWVEDQRMMSMMAPTLAFLSDGQRIVTGSGGSNRLRTAILQVLLNLIDGNLSLQQAVQNPRIHLENDFLNIEDGFDQSIVDRLTNEYPDHRNWDDKNLFFGGAHSVSFDGEFSGVGDPRRGGYSVIV